MEDPISTTFIYRADSSNNKIYFGSLDAVTGELAEHGSIDMGAGENPVSLVVSIDKKYLFVAKAGTNKI